MNTKFALDKKEILDFASNLSNIARQEGWISNYDSDSDSFAVRVPKLSREARKRYLNEEFALYLNEKNGVEGVFIEYFLSNFVSHHGNFKEIKKEIQELQEGSGAMVNLPKNDTDKMIPDLQEAILNSLVSSKTTGSHS